MTSKNSLFTPTDLRIEGNCLNVVSVSIKSLGRLVYQGFFLATSLALALLYVKQPDEEKTDIKRFMISRVGIYGVTLAIIFACAVVSFLEMCPLDPYSNDKQYEESQSVAFIPSTDRVRIKCHA